MKPTTDQANSFINEILEEWVQEMILVWRNDIAKKGLIDTQTLYDSFSEVFQKANAQTTAKADIAFVDYGRFLDIMKKSRAANALNKKAWTGGKKAGRPLNWYARNLYGMLNPLIEKLTLGFSEWAKNNIVNYE